MGTPKRYLAVAWSSDGKQIATADQDSLSLWNASNGECNTVYQVHNSPYLTASLVWSLDSTHVGLDTGKSTLQVWNLNTDNSVLISIQMDVTRAMLWLPDGHIALIDRSLKTKSIEIEGL